MRVRPAIRRANLCRTGRRRKLPEQLPDHGFAAGWRRSRSVHSAGLERRRIDPGIATLTTLDPALAPLPVSSSPPKLRGDTALISCRGFGGNQYGLGHPRRSGWRMIAEAPSGARCGIDTIELARVEQLLQDKSPDELNGLFTEQELLDAGTSAGRVTTLAGCFAAKEACCKLFPRELALERITPADRVRRRE